MPNTFKALASIAAWILFIGGCVGLVMVLLGTAIGGGFSTPEEGPSFKFHAGMALNIGTIVLSVVVMRLRQKME